MKNYKLKIINSKGKTINFNVLEPTNITELADGINNSTDFDGMIVFAIKPDVVIQPIYIQNYRQVSLDIVSVDWHGNIKSIHKNLLHFFTLIMNYLKEKLRKQPHLPFHQRE